ncbi:unnamed protein product [Gongylonema pulchrum]|uniref:B box-type domain-containing protein n=1 Tax=Gongylonema pulchrum TaxID=637853 RepID=A0A183CZM1_9BILA|nr:unnamed protein product [Gongylonema pulchrum]
MFQPRVLDCLHSMCEDCIIAQLDGHRDGESNHVSAALSTDFELEGTCEMRPPPPGVIRCAACFQVSRFSIASCAWIRESHVGNDVRFVNHMLQDFVRLHEEESVSVTKGSRSCRSCKSEQLAMAVCKECASDLCKNCYQAHRDMKLFEGHTALTYAELAQNPSELPRDPVMCVLHPQMPYALLCSSCEAPICGQCHAEHSDAKSTEDICSCVPARQRMLAEQYETIKGEIVEAFSEYHKALDAVQEEFLHKLDKLRDEQETDLNNLNKRVNKTTVKIADAIA